MSSVPNADQAIHDLTDRINLSPLLRPLGIPKNLVNICLVTLQDRLGEIAPFLKENPQLKIRALVLLDIPAERAAKMRIELNGEVLPVREATWLQSSPQLEKIFLGPDNPVALAALLSQLGIFLSSLSIQNIWLASQTAPEHSLRAPNALFLEKHAEELAKARELFADKFSSQTFCGRVKALLTGNSGFIPIAPHREYFHPLVKPEEGDIMIDGGVSDMVGAQLEFARAAGVKGRIFGFEPIPQMAEKAARQLADWPSYRLQCAGLAEADGEAIFENLRDSSRMSDSETLREGQMRCELTSIDSFCRKNMLGRIDCIKLDVEGAELAALKGAENTIRRNRPRLIICLYHKPVDMFEIPFWIKKTVPEYELYLAHSSCQFMDTILYARCPKG